MAGHPQKTLSDVQKIGLQKKLLTLQRYSNFDMRFMQAMER
jgi:hypothetical protein